MNKWLRRLALAACFVVIVVTGGTVGYVLIEGQPLGDSFYMAVVTVSAVGYNEIFPLSPAGRVLTVSLLVAGITSIGIWFATITEALLQYDLVLGDRSTNKELRRVKDHIIICGAGRTGRRVARELQESGRRCVIIEADGAKVRELKRDDNGLDLHLGDATSDSVLRRAAVERASGLVACLTRDADTLVVCLSARALAGEELRIVARASDDESVRKMLRAGANTVVSPSVTTALSLAESLEDQPDLQR